MHATRVEAQREPAESAEECLHAEVDELGFDRNTTFARCRTCGRVLILQGDTAWYLRR